MFRTQNNPFDDAVVKATDENLTSENWEFIMNVVDKVGSEENGAKDAVAAMIKRLAHRNANVQLYTLELANALSQNCGRKMHQELASRSFTDALLRLAADRNTHREVKAKILERMSEWSDMFSRDPDLGIMEGAYSKLKSQNPNLHPPSKPQKQLITDSDRRREEEELQMALRLSIQDKSSAPAQAASSTAQASSSSATATTAAPAASTPAPQPGTTAATVSRVRALFDFQPSESGELAFRKGDIIAVLESVYKDWWRGSLRGQTGIFPLNYVEKLQDPTKEELEREAQMEAEVFAEIRNVEKLLALLSTSSRTGDGDVRDNEEITTLYHSTLAIRPKLIELIGKYSQKKDDFTSLNEKFIKARRDYESLLESSMSQPQIGYGRPQYGYGAGPGGPPPPNVYSSPPPQHAAYPPHGPPANEPQRFYTPAQEQQYPPQSAPSPFYMLPHGQGGPSQVNINKPGSADPYSANKPQRMGSVGRPQSMAYGAPGVGSGTPQELATSTFDSPIDNRQSFIPPGVGGPSQPDTYDPHHPPQSPSTYTHVPPAQQQPYAPQHASSFDNYPSAPQHQAPQPSAPQQQQQQPSDPYSYQTPQQSFHSVPQQPSQPPPDIPGAAGVPPAAQSGGYPTLNTQSPAPPSAPTTYQAYQPPGGGAQRWQGGASAPAGGARAVAGGSAEEEGFYR